jgi:hypothetical protein
MERRKVGRRTLLAGVGGAVAGSLLPVKAFAAGSLNPPPGPVSYQGRDLASISAKIAPHGTVAEPRENVLSLPGGADCSHEIVNPGSYTLSANLIGVPGMHGLRISASNVDLQLNGFHIIGAADPTGNPTASAIVCTGSVVTISDGNAVGPWLRGIDFEHASNFVIWDMTVAGAIAGGFFLGDNGQSYDNDAYQCQGPGYTLLGTHTLIEQCGAWTCAVGFKGINSPNLLLRNCATGCPVPFDLGNNSYGPIVIVAPGDISANANTRHPEANYGF